MKTFIYALLKTVNYVATPTMALVLVYFIGQFFEHVYRNSNSLVFFSGIVSCYMLPFIVLGLLGSILCFYLDDKIEYLLKNTKR